MTTIDSPAAQVARLAGAGQRVETPCGDGAMVWRIWGPPSGGGEKLVLFHGGFGSWTHWFRNIPELARHYRLIVASLPGLGESDDAPTPHTASGLAAIAAAGIDRILAPGERFHLTGFSFGGLIGGHVAAHFGERCRTLTLVGAGGLGLKRSAMAPLRSWRHLPDEAAGGRAILISPSPPCGAQKRLQRPRSDIGAQREGRGREVPSMEQSTGGRQ